MHELGTRFAQLRLRDLLLLEKIEELGSLRAVAEFFHLTQPAVTHALKALEHAFGALLVARGRRGQRGVGLTIEGAAVLIRLRLAKTELLAAQAAAKLPNSFPLRIGSIPTGILDILPRALADINQSHPSLRFTIMEAAVPQLWNGLARGELDVILSRMPDMSDWDNLVPSMTYRTIRRERLELVAAANHPASRKRKVDLAELARRPWVLPPKGGYTRLAFDQLFIQQELDPPDPVVINGSYQANLLLAATGQFLTVSPASALAVYQDFLKLKVFPAPWRDNSADIVVACRENSKANPGVAQFMHAIANV